MTLRSINSLGCLLRDQGQLAEAEAYLRESVERARSALGKDSLSTLMGVHNLGALLQQEGRLGEAEPFLSEELEIRRRVQGEEHPETLQATNTLGALLVAEGKLAEAEALLLPAATLAEAQLEPTDKARCELSRTLAALYQTWEEADPGEGYAAKATAWRAKAGEEDAGGSNDGKP
jgi:hypothetical protein